MAPTRVPAQVLLRGLNHTNVNGPLDMCRGVPPACSKPDPVPIRLAAKKTPCPRL